MSKQRIPIDPVALKPLVDIVRARSPKGKPMTLAEAETAVLELWRSLGPQLLESLLQQSPETAEADTSEKRGHRPSVAKD